MDRYNTREIEQKWQKKWVDEKVFAARDDSPKPKYYALVEFPYPSGDGLHTGHVRSYTAMDIVARKRRKIEGHDEPSRAIGTHGLFVSEREPGGRPAYGHPRGGKGIICGIVIGAMVQKHPHPDAPVACRDERGDDRRVLKLIIHELERARRAPDERKDRSDTVIRFDDERAGAAACGGRYARGAVPDEILSSPAGHGYERDNAPRERCDRSECKNNIPGRYGHTDAMHALPYHIHDQENLKTRMAFSQIRAFIASGEIPFSTARRATICGMYAGSLRAPRCGTGAT